MADALSQFSDYDTVSYGNNLQPQASTAMKAQMGMSAASGLITGLLGMKTTSMDIDRSNEALMRNLESSAESLSWEQQIRSQQMEDMAVVAGSNMSMIGFEQMVEQSSAEAKAAESGSTTVSEEQTAQTYINRNFRESQVQKEYETATRSTMLQGAASLMSFENMQESMLSNQLDPMNAAMKVASAGMSGQSSGMRLFF